MDDEQQEAAAAPLPPPPLAAAAVPHEELWATVEAELAVDASRRAALVAAVVRGDLSSVQALIEADHKLAFHTLNRKTTLLVRMI